MKNLPDIQSAKLLEKHSNLLDWVGIENMALPIQLFSNHERLSARISTGVNLTSKHNRGIHMSRLYSLVEKKFILKPIFDSAEHLVTCHREIVESQEGLASWGDLTINFDYSYHHQSLESGNSTQRVIPMGLSVFGSKESPQLKLFFELTYSSTCPQSYALATQSMIEAFQIKFANQDQIKSNEVFSWLQQGLVATPHAQRSRANLFLVWSYQEWIHWIQGFASYQDALKALIQQTEAALGTPSQALVKRGDEKRFAELNAANTMFCEDAARRLYYALDQAHITQFWGEVRHFESLHPFDVRAQFCKRDEDLEGSKK